MKIVFTKKANERLVDIADYLYQQNCSISFVVNYIKDFRIQLRNILTPFPEAGKMVPEYGENIRRIVCKDYSFLYQINNNTIEILTVYKENLA
jgi:plasmid stabilization system protein ParE